MWRPIRNLILALLVGLAAAPARAQTSADDLAARTADTLYRLAHLFAPPAQSITIPNTFTNGTVADATQVNANFTALSSNAVNRNGGTMLGTLNSRAVTPTSDATYDVASNVLRFKAAWFSGAVTAASFSGNLDASQLASNTVPTARLGSGSATSSTFLRGDSSWTALPASGECILTRVGKTANYSPALCELVEITSGSSITITLPAVSGATSTNYRVGLKNNVAATVTVARTGSDTIDGGTSYTTAGVQYESYDFYVNAAGTGWMIR